MCCNCHIGSVETDLLFSYWFAVVILVAWIWNWNPRSCSDYLIFYIYDHFRACSKNSHFFVNGPFLLLRISSSFKYEFNYYDCFQLWIQLVRLCYRPWLSFQFFGMAIIFITFVVYYGGHTIRGQDSRFYRHKKGDWFRASSLDLNDCVLCLTERV